MSFDIRLWWAALSAIALGNCVLWWLAARSLRHKRRAAETTLNRTQLLLSGVYVAVCAFRSFLPRADVQRICLVDTTWSSVFVGRSVATIAELCFAVQWAHFIQHVANGHRITSVRFISRLLVPMIVWAELASWYAVVSTNFLGNVIEQSTWTLAGLLISYCYVRLYPQAGPALRRFLAWTSPVLAAFIWFMCNVDIPHYVARWLADEHAQKHYLSWGAGLKDAATHWTVTYAWSAWRDEVAWMTLYFSIGVWLSISLSHAPLQEPARQRHRSQAAVH